MKQLPPLQLAAAQGDVAAVRRLLEQEPDAAAARDSYPGFLPLHRAAAGGQAAVVRMLLAAHPAGATTEDFHGRLPLHLAIFGRHAAVVAVLLTAAPQTADSALSHPETCCLHTKPLHLAAQLGSPALVKLLLQAVPETAAALNAHMDSPLHWAALCGLSPCPDARPYCCAVHSRHIRHQPSDVECVRLLLAAAPALALAPNSCSSTPLHLACRGGYAAMVLLLLEAAPAAAEVPDRHGFTPLQVALRPLWASIDMSDDQREARLRCARALMARISCTTRLLREMETSGGALLPAELYCHVVAMRPLTGPQWGALPRGCEGLGALLPAVLERSAEEVRHLVRRLYRRDRRRLWEFLRCMARLQQQTGLALPQHVLCQTLHFL